MNAKDEYHCMQKVNKKIILLNAKSEYHWKQNWISLKAKSERRPGAVGCTSDS